MFYLHRQFDVFKSFDNIDINRQLHTGQRKVREADFFFPWPGHWALRKKINTVHNLITFSIVFTNKK